MDGCEEGVWLATGKLVRGHGQSCRVPECPHGMMGSVGFFDEFPPSPPPAPTSPSPRASSFPPRQPWTGPPEGGLGGFVPWNLVLLGSENAVVVLRHFEAFPTGLLFELVSAPVSGTAVPSTRPAPLARKAAARTRPPRRLNAPRLGVRFADGHSAASGTFRTLADQRASDEPYLHGFIDAFGGGSLLRRTFWLWPVPPPGRLTWFATWPAIGVDEVSVEVDASILTTAASAAVFLSDEWLVP